MCNMHIANADLGNSNEDSVLQTILELRQIYGITHITKCQCGAFTFEKNEKSVCVKPENAAMFFTAMHPSRFFTLANKLSPQFYTCNHCANNWGLDLCRCGSGEFFWDCHNEEGCGVPSEDMGVFIDG